MLGIGEEEQQRIRTVALATNVSVFMKQNTKLSIRDLDLPGKRLFLRVDFNVPIQAGKVLDDTRIRTSLPTIELALKKNARIILASHLGRPKGKQREEYSLKPVAAHLSSLLKREVLFVSDCVGAQVRDRVDTLTNGRVLLLENLRFRAGETSNDFPFARKLASLAQEYCNDAFGTAHRAHASTVGVPEILGKGATGLLMEKELDYLSRVLYNPQHPVVAILGGAKVSDKMEVIGNFLNFADTILVGGGMAFTFLKAQGRTVGKSMVANDKLDIARETLRKAKSRGVKLLLPPDAIIAQRCQKGMETRLVQSGSIAEGWMGLDVGPQTIKEFKRVITQAKTIIWNGPLGVFEIEEFAQGTLQIANAVAESQALSVVGGGDSISALRKAAIQNEITHLSTGGGASLEFLAGKKLPSVEILTDR